MYHKIFEPEVAAEELAKTAGMKINPNIFDQIVAKLSQSSEPINELPKDNHKLAMSKIGERSAYLKEKKELKRLPCFVIDGVDLS